MRDFSHDHSCLALNTATLGHNVAGKGAGWTPHEVVDACSAKGIQGITFWIREFRDLDHATDAGQYARAKNVRVIGLCRTPYLIGPDAPSSSEELDQEFHRTIRYASALGAQVITIVVGAYDPNAGTINDNLDRIAEAIARYAGRAAEENVKLAIEPLHPVYCGNRSCLTTVRDAVTMVEQIDHRAVGLAIDVYHVWWDTALEMELSRISGQGKVFGFHLCDWLHDTADILLDRGMMGDGVAEIRRIRDIVESVGYEGFCEVEVFSERNWWKREPHEVLDTIIHRFRTVC